MTISSHPRSPRPPTHPAPPGAPAGEAPERILGARPQSTAIAIFGILVTALLVPSSGAASGAARFAAIGVGISLLTSVALDLAEGLGNLLRADLLALLAMYFLTLFEFLFPQPIFDETLDLSQTRTGLQVIWVAFIGLLLGRHLWVPRKQPWERVLTQSISPEKMVLFAWLCAILGYLHMFVAVNFNFVELINDFMAPRFTQPWGRGRLGDWKALFIELALLIQLVPPVAGIALGRHERYPRIYFWPLMALFAFTLFYGFTSGTRNVFGTFLITFLMGYVLAVGPQRKTQIAVASFACAAAMLVATRLMLEFRNYGFKNWIAGTYQTNGFEDRRTLYVDYNLVAIARLADYFPREHPYLGLEVPYIALIHPIPRAIWPNKPTDMSVSIEDVFGESGLTIAATYAGEFYMAGGLIGVMLASLFFGGLSGWWNSLSSPRNSELGILIYASGFFAVVITMRSSFVFTTTILPTVAGLVSTRWLVPAAVKGAQKLGLARRGPVRAARPEGPPARSALRPRP